MKSLEMKELEKLSDTDLVKKLNDLRSEFSKLKSAAARGTLKKELGEIKTVRRNVARVLTALNARNAPAAVTGDHETKPNDAKSKVETASSEESKAVAQDA